MALKEISRNKVVVARSWLVMCSEWRVWRGRDEQTDRRKKIIEVLLVSLPAPSVLFSQRTRSISITKKKILNLHVLSKEFKN
jgi:hypothetical protein